MLLCGNTFLYDLHYGVVSTCMRSVSCLWLQDLVQEGKVKYIGVSEMSAENIRRAHAIHPLSALEMEWSLFSRDAERDLVPTCRELGIGILAYAPLGRGEDSQLDTLTCPCPYCHGSAGYTAHACGSHL